MFGTIFVVDDGGEQGRDALSLARSLGGPDASFITGGFESVRGVPEVARLERADLIVIGSDREAERILHGSPVPVAISPRGFADSSEDRLRVIGVGFDGQPESRAALRAAERLALEHGATLRVFAVVLPNTYTSSRIEPTPEEYREMIRETLADQLHAEVDTLDDRVRAAASVVRGDPAEQLVARSREGLDLLVVGSRGYGPFRRVLFGSVSSHVLDKCECPLLVFPRTAVALEGPRGEPDQLGVGR